MFCTKLLILAWMSAIAARMNVRFIIFTPHFVYSVGNVMITGYSLPVLWYLSINLSTRFTHYIFQILNYSFASFIIICWYIPEIIIGLSCITVLISKNFSAYAYVGNVFSKAFVELSNPHYDSETDFLKFNFICRKIHRRWKHSWFLLAQP